MISAPDHHTALQTIVSRTIDPQDPARGDHRCRFTGGGRKHHPAKAEMEGTNALARTELGPQCDERLTRNRRTHRPGSPVATADEDRGWLPAHYNDDALSALVEATSLEVLGDQCVVTRCDQHGVEDFAYYAQRCRHACSGWASRPPGAENCPSLHNPGFNFTTTRCPVGIRLFCEMTARFLKNRRL